MKQKRTLRITALVLLLALAASGGWAWYASRQVPQFYTQALATTEQAERDAHHEMQRTVAAAASDLMSEDRWQITLTDAQLNGWLAVELENRFTELLPEDIQDPRVALTPEAIHVAWTQGSSERATTYSVAIEPFMISPNVLALRLRAVHAGRLPVPRGIVIAAVEQIARETELPLAWRQQDGDPVAVVRLDPFVEPYQPLSIDTIQLRDGKLIAAGQGSEATSQIEAAATPVQSRESNDNRQR